MRNSIRRALAVAWLLGLAACGDRGQGGPPGPMFTSDNGLLTVPANSPLRSHMSVAPVESASLAQGLQAPAVVEADPRLVANVLSPASGRVLAVRVGLGDHVRKGQTLAIISSGDFAQANADVAKAEDAVALARKALERVRGVREAGGVATKDLEAAESGFVQAQAELDRARIRQRSLNAGAAGGELVLTAPLSGTVTALTAAPGAQVTDLTAPLMTVTNTEHVIITAQVGERDAAAIAAGQPADIALSAFPGQVLHGRVASVNAVLEPDTRRRKVRITLQDAPSALLPNMYGAATFMRRGPEASAHVAVPQSAVLMNNDAMSVLVEAKPWVFERRAVKLGDENERFVEVVSGLKAGDRVVTRGGILLND